MEIGWAHFECKGRRKKLSYHEVRTPNGGGVRHVICSKTLTIEQFKQDAIDLFLVGGSNPKGKTEEFTFKVLNSSFYIISPEKTIIQLYDELKAWMLRLYLGSKSIYCDAESSSPVIPQSDSTVHNQTEYPAEILDTLCTTEPVHNAEAANEIDTGAPVDNTVDFPPESLRNVIDIELPLLFLGEMESTANTSDGDGPSATHSNNAKKDIREIAQRAYFLVN